MTSDIQFGDVQEAEPNRGLRPDQDAHYCVLAMGRTRPFHPPDESDAESPMPAEQEEEAAESTSPMPSDELRIYVDLDVMRSMEQHAVSNTGVELGGVLLGHQQIDDEGVPFVVISECLRAEHYEATRGSFKFTHDTWSQITDERSQFHPDLEMVGWYHTHPGWGIFLSGMDLFICNHFFNRKLDVALVIDPVARERGWFQWSLTDEAQQTRETRGFYLISNRYRESELRYFANVLTNGHAMNSDSPYSQTAMGGGQPVINISDNRRPVFDLAVLAMMTMQFLFLALLAWKLLAPGGESPNGLAGTVQAEAQNEILASIVERQTGDQDLARKYAEQKLQNTRMRSNLDGQILLSESINGKLLNAQETIRESNRTVATLKESSASLEAKNRQLTDQVKSLGGEVAGEGFDWRWVTYPAILMLAVAVGGMAGFFLAPRRDPPFTPGPRRDTPETVNTTGDSGGRMTLTDDPTPETRDDDREPGAE